MGTFAASLRAIGDATPLPATVELEDGQLSIAAGEMEIGTWALSEIELEPTPSGYRMAAEGEQILIELKELDAFKEALSAGRFKRRFSVRRKENGASAARAPKPARTATDTVATKPQPSPVEPQEKTRGAVKRSPAGEGLAARGLGLLDDGINKAQKRFGPYLPAWIFSRAMFFILFGTVVLMLVFPGSSSVVLLISGGLMIAFGAITYSDGMLASRWLPGRMQPPHVLIIGISVLVLGVLFGIIAS